MDFIEHDLKSLLTVMPSPFLQSEIKTLMLQLLSAVAHCHSNWILHRDLKTSNLLMNNRGMIKVADFGLARRYGDPVGVGGMTQLVVTLWYRYAKFPNPTKYSSTHNTSQCSRNITRGNNLLYRSRHMVCRLHLCGAPPQGTTLPSQRRNRTARHDIQAPRSPKHNIMARLHILATCQDACAAFPSAKSIQAKISLYDNGRDRFVNEPVDL